MAHRWTRYADREAHLVDDDAEETEIEIEIKNSPENRASKTALSNEPGI
jgi:hypothetical protein